MPPGFPNAVIIFVVSMVKGTVVVAAVRVPEMAARECAITYLASDHTSPYWPLNSFSFVAASFLVVPSILNG